MSVRLRDCVPWAASTVEQLGTNANLFAVSFLLPQDRTPKLQRQRAPPEQSLRRRAAKAGARAAWPRPRLTRAWERFAGKR
eukprot:6297339-Alexandrium_andersonii.AAC.1